MYYFFQSLLDERDGISSNQIKGASARSMLQSRVRVAYSQKASPSQ